MMTDSCPVCGMDKSPKSPHHLMTFDLQVNSVTGDVSLRKSFPADVSAGEYKVLVVATDGGAPPLCGRADLLVTVVTEATPLFDRPLYSVAVREDASPSASVLSVNASGAEGRRVVFTLQDGDPTLQFDVGFDTGVVRLREPLDYESAPYYRLTVRATDPQTGARAEADVDVTVLDVNDNPPVFLHPAYRAELPENALAGTTVLTVGSTAP